MSHLKSVLDEDGYNITATELISVSCHTPLIEERKYNEEKKHFMEQADAINSPGVRRRLSLRKERF